MIMSLGAGSPERLTKNSAPEFDPTWSPDGRFIAFRRESEGNCGVFIVPAGGGPERKLTDTTRPNSAGAPALDGKRGMSWSRDGSLLAMIDVPSPGAPNAIVSVSIATGGKRILTSPHPGLEDAFPVFSADGRTLAFARGRVAMGQLSLYLQPLNSDMTPRGEPRRLFESSQFLLGVDWAPSGRALVYSTRDGCWLIPVARGGPRLLAGIGESMHSLSASASQHMLAYTRVPASDENIYRLSLLSQTEEAIRPSFLPLLPRRTTRQNFARWEEDCSRVQAIRALRDLGL
jgi:Tol biopolymer transport system component